jgi:inositol 1,4,5-triphosphate receptor type 1
VDVACRAFHQETLEDDDDDADDASTEGEDGVSPKEVIFLV